MTLGLNKTNVFSTINNERNERKKRKIEETMNGFNETEDNIQTISLNHNNNERFEEFGYETPPKRARSLPQKVANNSNNTNNTNSVNRRYSFQPMALLSSLWNKMKGKNDRNANQELTPNEANVDNLAVRVSANTELTASRGLSNTNESGLSSNPMNITNDSSVLTQTKNYDNRRKRRFSAFRLDDKHKYQQLLNSHKLNPLIRPFIKKSTKKPEVIDLMSSVSTIANTSLPTTSLSSHSQHLSQEVFKREELDNNTKSHLIDRIKNQGIVAQTTVSSSFSHSTPFGSYNQQNFIANRFSTPKSGLFIGKKTEPKSKQLPQSPQMTQTLPNSSIKFKELLTDRHNYLETNWFLDLKSSLTQSTDRNDQKILKSELILKESKVKRETDCQNLSQQLRKPFTRTELSPFIPYLEIPDELEDIEEEEEEESVPTDLPTLTPEMDRLIDDALRPTPPNEVLTEGFSVQIMRKDMETLKGLNWLNDEIINFYLSLVVERGKNDNFSTVYAFNTFFYKKLKDNGPKSLMRWTRRVDIFANDFIFIPIHLGMHWCLAVIDFVNKRIEYYDSMGGKNMECIHMLRDYLKAESLDKKKKEFSMTDWSLETVKDIPQQMNGSDCGMFSCKYAEYISRKAKINFSQAHMPYFRRRMVYEILTKQLL